jgi:arylsulfatase A-like enzyme
MADHGGHDRGHGSDMPEDMIIPLFFYGKDFPKGEVIKEQISLLNIAPTIAKLLGVTPEPDWEGTPVI